jgi:WD40 repeat protein
LTWRLLWARGQSDELATLGTHPWIVTCVAVSPDGQWAASGSMDQPDDATNSLKLWRIGALTEAAAAAVAQAPSPVSVLRADSARPLAASNTLGSVAFTEDSRTLVSAGVNGVRFWDVATGAARTDFPAIPGQEIALAGDVLVASPNHPFFSGSAPEPLWRMNLASRELRQLPLRGRHPALSPDGKRLALLDAGRSIQRYDLATERLLFTVATKRLLFRLRFSPDGRRLAGAGQMTAARVWNLDAPGTPPRSFESTHNVWDAAFTPDGATLITATSHQQLELWDAATAEQRGSLAGHANEVRAVAPTPAGTRLVSGGKDWTMRLWPLAPKAAAPAVPQWRYARPMFSPDGARLLTYAQTNWSGAATVWETWNSKLASSAGNRRGLPTRFRAGRHQPVVLPRRPAGAGVGAGRTRAKPPHRGTGRRADQPVSHRVRARR